jgi:hypothetical protein
MHSYSPFFQTLHDETQPVGELGNGTHYSVLRVPIWHDASLKPSNEAQLLDFAVIWDQDHDERVIEVVERIYFDGLLAPVRFIGERKGTLSVLLDLTTLKSWSRGQYQRYHAAVNEIGPNDDRWPATVDAVEGLEHSIIHASPQDVAIYLKNIQLLWRLGLKPNTEHVSRSMLERMAEHMSQQRSIAGIQPVLSGPENDDIPF